MFKKFITKVQLFLKGVSFSNLERGDVALLYDSKTQFFWVKSMAGALIDNTAAMMVTSLALIMGDNSEDGARIRQALYIYLMSRMSDGAVPGYSASYKTTDAKDSE